MPVIIPDELKPNLFKYKYNGVDKSLLSRYVLGYYWNWLVSLFPMTMAPNLITLYGLLCIFANFALQLYYDPEWESIAPKWVYISYGIGLWIYASFDAIDGKQARRTGTSGPLGELFDHSCDAINTIFVSLLMAAAANMGMSWLTASSILVALTNFFLSTWEQYHTGTLYLSHFSGPVEGICMMVIFLITTGFTGPHFWGQGFKTTLGLLEVPLLKSIPDYPINLVVSYMSFIIMSYNVLTSIYNVLSFCTKNEKSVIEALSGLVPFTSAALATYFWLDASPFIIERHFIIFMLFIGASFAYTLLFLILNHVIKAPFKYFNRMFLPIFFGCIQANSENWFKIPKIFTDEQESFFILICFVGSIAQYLLTTFQVIDEICRFLDIWCLAIKPKGKKNE